MSIKDIFQVAFSIIASIGGSSIIIVGLSSWLGKVWASRILEKDRNKFATDLETTKAGYLKEIEEYKLELEKSKSQFIRYSESQYNLYNTLWLSLYKLKQVSDELWKDANIANLQSFVQHLVKTIDNVGKNQLLIEDKHFDSLQEILNTFSEFKVGKTELLKLKKLGEEASRPMDIQGFIQQNETNREKYNSLLDEISKEFKKQLWGPK